MDNTVFQWENIDFFPGALFSSLIQNDGNIHQYAINIPTDAEPLSLLEDGWSVLASNSTGYRQDVTFQTKNAVGYFTKYSDSSVVYAKFASSDFSVLEKYGETLLKNAPPVKLFDDGTINVSFWVCGSSGPTSQNRRIDVAPWSDISRNYCSSTVSQIEKLLTMLPPFEGGRLVLWHGLPGTGKSHAIRSLIKHWQPWCDINYIVDPEVLFRTSGHLMSLLLDNKSNSKIDEEQYPNDTFILQGADRWRLFIMEDCDEFLQADAKSRQGQALSRLLNIADGFIGQGLRVLFLITTNEKLSNIHPAVARTGRCMANTEFGQFSREEAVEWLGFKDVELKPMTTLSDLYDKKRNNQQIALDKDTKSEKIGQYL